MSERIATIEVPRKGKVFIDLPYWCQGVDGVIWHEPFLRQYGRLKPEKIARNLWLRQRAGWEDVAAGLVDLGFDVDVLTWERENPTVICDTRCTSAVGFDCSCSCGGKNHGNRKIVERGYLVGETTLVIQDGDWIQHARRWQKINNDNGN